MIGLIVYGTIFLVSIICIIIFVQAIKYAKRNKKSTLKYGSVTSIILFFLVTWDWLPSEIYYAYQCAQLPPLQVYKTPEQWVSENQDLMSGKNVTFKINSEKDLPQVSEEGYRLSFNTNIITNKLFINATYKSDQFLRAYNTKETIIDRRTGEILVSDITFDQVVRFFSPPEIGGGKKCGYNNKRIKNESYFYSLKKINDFYQLQQEINKGALK